MRFFIPTLALVALACMACASAKTPQSTKVAVEQQLRAATENERIADAHAARYDPKATERTGGCKPAAPGDDASVICWSSQANPTADYLEKARRYRALAEKRRAESDELRAAEAKACGGVSELDRALSPFSHPEDVVNVSPVRLPDNPALVLGAVIAFRAVDGMSEPRLQQIVTCHLARNACLDSGSPEVAYCPLALRNVWTTVVRTGDGLFAVTVRSHDPAVAQEILRRAQALLAF